LVPENVPEFRRGHIIERHETSGTVYWKSYEQHRQVCSHIPWAREKSPIAAVFLFFA
jgi:hypothetical protein